jgi:hypothetical protein
MSHDNIPLLINILLPLSLVCFGVLVHLIDRQKQRGVMYESTQEMRARLLEEKKHSMMALRKRIEEIERKKPLRRKTN